jgi:HEPN domain-containing protein
MAKEYELWLIRAKSALKLGMTNKEDEICYEDLCFQLQQSSEKALKAYLVFLGIEPPKTHSFVVILQELARYIQIPREVEDVIDLNEYAVQTRYPGNFTQIEKDEYFKAVQIAEKILMWVLDDIKKA